MFRIAIVGLATLAVCFMFAAAAWADPWKDESGHGKGWGKHKKEWKAKEKEWKEHRGEPPPWARGKGYWDGHFKHGRPPAYYDDDFDDDRGHHWHRGSRDDWGYQSVPTPRNHWPAEPYYGGYWKSNPPPYVWPEAYPYDDYDPARYGQGWDVEGSIRVHPRSYW